jgi:8-oxo-dGTP pyrophosphatase MutT (NUDIX family)
MDMTLPPSVHKLASLDITLSPDPWPFETANAAAIAAHFEAAKERIPLLWNGRTLKLTRHDFSAGAFTGVCCETSFAAFLAWRDWGAPDRSARNLFGSAILRCADGALLYGVMGGHTATAGLVYPPGGNLDPQDVTPDGSVDVISAIDRELEEETGLAAGDLRRGDLLVAFDGPRVSIAQVFDTDRAAEDLRRDILHHSAASEEQELADMRIIRRPGDLDIPGIVPYARAIGDYMLAPPGASASREGQGIVHQE